MKVILLKDVPKLGKKGELHEVSDGFGRNYLLVRGLAMVATEGKIRAIDKEKADRSAHEARELQQARELAETLRSKPLQVMARSGEGGRLFGSITSSDLAEALKTQHGLDFDRRLIKLETPLKTLGEHRVTLKLHPKVKAELLVCVKES
jgi:large subunit ribosomal protein L9